MSVPYTPILLLGGGISIVRGRLSAFSGRKSMPSPNVRDDDPRVQEAEITNVQGMVRIGGQTILSIPKVDQFTSFKFLYRSVGELVPSLSLRMRAQQFSTTLCEPLP